MVAADTVGSAACADLLSHRKVELTGVAEQQNTTFPIYFRRSGVRLP